MAHYEYLSKVENMYRANGQDVMSIAREKQAVKKEMDKTEEAYEDL